jgi:excinuclease ABC subunit C
MPAPPEAPVTLGRERYEREGGGKAGLPRLPKGWARPDERTADPVYELQRVLGLPTVPRFLVCFDNSHSQGVETVSSAVVFENGRPNRAEYRKFKAKTVEGIDDFASMAEAVTRYLGRRVEEGRPLPDLVVIDGGKGQLGAARAAMEALGLAEIPTIALAKQDEEVFRPGARESIRLPRRSPALRLLQRARDEAHRFAITFHRARRSKRSLRSSLLDLPGVGPARRRALLDHFGTPDAVRAADPAGLAAVPGIGVKRAAELWSALHPEATADADPIPNARADDGAASGARVGADARAEAAAAADATPGAQADAQAAPQAAEGPASGQAPGDAP